MSDRNSQEEIKKDFEFLKEMQETWEKCESDIDSRAHLGIMINDWKNELGNLVENNDQ